LFDRLHRERGVTLIVITHGAEVAARAERTLWIRDGQIDLVQLTGGAVTRCAV
jgi:predicted ABC-type transport system involved in lysophospholipase L1 biosynthesis ATPase subunit